MLKSPMMCSLLMSFGLSAMILGCEPANKSATKPPLASSAPGSTTGGGVEVPSTPSLGTPETPVTPPAVTTPEATPTPEVTPTPEATPTPEVEPAKPEEPEAPKN